ncbi:Retrovirus-related Pol polyprotein from transposon RE1 [Vitis vinifera]|uniref:Retrovirus-related Pol polyprotein from transposon RE1 n=1 Tax=Vitis vinifera TaxID=29760 RepID=A0A438BSR7_VITVI|nr:Retrovirus-related Pol polyprotein from transposon RE1 [Vitis vinifera]
MPWELILVSLSLNHVLPIKLDHNNYILWKTQIENVVYANGFEEYIDGTKPCLPQELHTGELNPDFVQWRRFDRMARILQLRLEFQTAKKGADPMLEYILKIKTISDNLAAIGEPVKETDHILQLLGGLGSEYNSIVASLTAPYLICRPAFAAAHIAATPSTQHPKPHQPRFQSPQPRFQSHYSGNRQHVPFSHTRPHNRPHNRPANRFSSSAPHRPPHLPTRPQCQLCGKFGHTVVKCYHRFDITYQGTNGVSSSQDSSPLQAMLAIAPDHQDSWFFDTGATHHLSHSAQTLSHVQPYSGADQVTIADGHSLPILNTDQVTKQTLLKGWLRDGLYEFPSSSSTHAFVSTSSIPALTPGAIWHSRLGHPAAPILSKALAFCNPSVSFQINKIAPCKICPLAKSHSLPYSLSSSHASQPLALIHTDLWGPAPSPSTSSARYFLLFIDDYSRSTACVFLGYASAHKGYICLDVSTSRLYISRDVLFHESSFPFQSIPAPLPLPQHTPLTSALINPPFLSTSSPPTVSFPIPTSSTDCTSTSDSLPPLLQVPFSPTPSPTPSSSPSPLNTHPMVTRAKSGIHKKKSFLMQTTSEPHTYSQAFKSEPWVQAMQHEYQALLRNHTWSLVPPPPSAHIVGCRWIYKLKYLPNGSSSCEACTIRLILALAVSFQWPIRQLDVENAFLNGDLQEEVFIAQPQGFVHPKYPHYVCKLHKALYGLKQAPRAWFQKLRVALVDYGFQSSRADTSLFIHHIASDILILLVYVDDILVTGSNPKLVSHFISYLHDKFALRDLGPLSYFLGIQAQQQGSVLDLNQQKYIADLLHRTQMEASKPAPTLGSLGRTLSQFDGVHLPNPSEYRRIVGALQYVTLTRPDIAFAGTISLGLHFQPSTSMELQGYSDADWASCPDDCRSTSGYCVFLGSNLISWSSSKQHLVSKSSAESEYRGLVSLTAELVWIQSLLQKLCLPTSPPVLWCDNQSAAHLVANPVFHSRSKHIELELHFIRESLRSKLTVTSTPMSLRGDDNQTDSNLTSSPTVVTEQPCNHSQTNSPNHLT